MLPPAPMLTNAYNHSKKGGKNYTSKTKQVTSLQIKINKTHPQPDRKVSLPNAMIILITEPIIIQKMVTNLLANPLRNYTCGLHRPSSSS
jgi:hypothetical protein